MRWAGAFVLALLLSSVAFTAQAQQASTAEGLFRQGGELFLHERYTEALEAYQRSYDLNPVNVVLYNIAMCQRALNRYGDAIDTFERYLSRGGDAIPGDRRQEVRDLIDEMRANAGGTTSQPTAAPPPLQPTAAPPPQTSPQPVSAAPPPDDTSVSATAPVEPTPAEPVQEPSRGRGLRIAAYVTGAVAVALLGTTVGLFAWNAGRDNDWEDTSAYLTDQWMASRDERTASDVELEQQYQDNEALGNELQTWGAVEWALFGVGVAALGAAVGLLVVGLRAGRQTTVSLAPGLGGFTFNLAWVTP